MAANSTDITAKKTRGRQKIEMKEIQNETDKIVTFSKRKSGIYKKVNELLTLTGVQVAFLVFSPAGKPFVFGQPSFKDLALRCLGQQKEPQLQSYSTREMFRQARIQELNQANNALLELMEELHQKEMVLREKLEGKPLNNWWNKIVDNMEMGELSDLESAYSKLFTKVEKRRMESVSLRNDTTKLNIDMNVGDGTFSSFSMHPYHQLSYMGSMTSSPAQIIDQLHMTPTTITMMPDYPMDGRLHDGIGAALDHPSSSSVVPHSDVSGYGP